MMTSIFQILYSAYKRSGYNDSMAYTRSSISLAAFRLAFFFPILTLCSEIIYKLNGLFIILYLIFFLVYSYKNAPRKESCVSQKKYDRIPKLLVFGVGVLLGVLLFFWGASLSIMVCKYIIDPYGLEGWLFRFFN